MNVLLIKSLIGLGSAGVVGLGGYGIYKALKPETTIRDVLKERNLVLLTNDSEWDAKVSEFNPSSSEPHKLEGFEKKTGSNDSEANRKAMKEACDKLLSTPLSKETDEIKSQIQKWCTKEKTSG